MKSYEKALQGLAAKSRSSKKHGRREPLQVARLYKASFRFCNGYKIEFTEHRGYEEQHLYGDPLISLISALISA